MTELVKLKRVAAIGYGLGQPPRLSDDGVPILRATNIHRGKFVRPGLIFAALKDLPLDRAPLLRSGEVLVVRSGAYTGDSALVTDDWAGAAPGYDLRISPTPSLDPRFLAYSLLGRLAMDHMVVASSRAAQPHLNAEELGDLPVLVLSPVRQRAIADYLDTETARIDVLIEKKKRLSDTLDSRWRGSLLQLLGVADASVDRQTPWVRTPLPDGWSIRPLRRLVERSWGGDWGSDPGTGMADLACVRAADFDFPNLQAIEGVARGFEASTLSSRGLRPGDMVLEKSGGGEGVPVGRVVAWRGADEAVPTNFAAGLRPACDADPDYVVLVFRAAYEAGLPWRSIKQTTGLQNLDLGHYLTHPWPMPNRQEQKRLAAELMTSLRQVRVLQKKLASQVFLLREHRQALITAAVTGELEIAGVA